jgi:hypothetical protein
VRTREPVMFKVFIAAGVYGGDGDIPALFDMLRYDAATVVTWSRAKDARDRDGWEMTLRSDRYTPERWHSFGIRPEALNG